MKQIRNLIMIMGFALIGYYGHTQEPASNIKIDAVKYKNITTVERNGFSVPIGEYWTIFNSTTNQYEIWNGTQWVAVAGNGYTEGTGINIVSNEISVDNSGIAITESQISDLSHTTDTQLNEAQVDAFVANNGYSSGAHTVDTNITTADLFINNGTRLLRAGTSTSQAGFYISDNYTNNYIGIKPVSNGIGLVSISEDAVFEDVSNDNEIRIALDFDSDTDRELIFDTNGVSYNGVTFGTGGTDDQTAAEVAFTPTGNTTSSNVQAAIEELQTGLDAASSGITTDQVNSLANQNKFKRVIKTADFSYITEDVEISTGADIAKKVIVSTDGNYEGELENVDLPQDASLILKPKGTLVTYFKENETGYFDDGNGTTGNELTVTAGNDCAIINFGGNEFGVSGSCAISTRSFGITPVYGSSPSASNPNPELTIGGGSGYVGEFPPNEGSDGDNWYSVSDGLEGTAVKSGIADTSNGWGDYVAVITTSGGVGAHNLAVNGLTNGEIYEYKHWYRITSGTGGSFQTWLGSTDNTTTVPMTSTDWTLMEAERTHADTGNNTMYSKINLDTNTVMQIKFSFRLKND